MLCIRNSVVPSILDEKSLFIAFHVRDQSFPKSEFMWTTHTHTHTMDNAVLTGADDTTEKSKQDYGVDQ